MQLSKQEFSKLSKRDKQIVTRAKTNNNKSTGKPRKQQQGLGRAVGGNRRLETAPVAFSKRLTQFNPVVKSKPNGVRCIKFKEYVQDIAGSVGFSTTAFACNPGLSNLFAWLSGQALFYQEYTVKNLRFTFETEKATTLSGKVMYAFLQDSSDPPPASKQEMLENLLKASGAIWEPFVLAISMANFPALGKSRFVRTGSLAANLDVKTYDIGQLIVATQGMADTSLVGELYIEYDIELRTPLQSSAQLANALSALLIGNGTVSNTSYLGTTPTITGGLDVTGSSGNTLVFNRVGQYLLSIFITGTGLMTVYNPAITGTATFVIHDPISNAAANVGTNAEFVVVVTVTARGQTVIIDNSGTSTTITASAVRVSLYASALG